jgi:hypothetical protein
MRCLAANAFTEQYPVCQPCKVGQCHTTPRLMTRPTQHQIWVHACRGPLTHREAPRLASSLPSNVKLIFLAACRRARRLCSCLRGPQWPALCLPAALSKLRKPRAQHARGDCGPCCASLGCGARVGRGLGAQSSAELWCGIGIVSCRCAWHSGADWHDQRRGCHAPRALRNGAVEGFDCLVCAGGCLIKEHQD